MKKVVFYYLLMQFLVYQPVISTAQDKPLGDDERPKIGLVLSGGGARGAAHVGVLKVLKENQIPIDMIAGTSFGAIVGRLYASGYSAKELEEILENIDWEEILKFFANSDQATKDRLILYVDAYFDDTRKTDAIDALGMETGEALFFGAILPEDGLKMSEYFTDTTVNKVFNFRRIFFENAKPLFSQRPFKDYIIGIGLLDYWKNHAFPDFCQPVGSNDFQCYLTKDF